MTGRGLGRETHCPASHAADVTRIFEAGKVGRPSLGVDGHREDANYGLAGSTAPCRFTCDCDQLSPWDIQIALSE